MVSIDLKKLVLKKEYSLIRAVIEATAPDAWIEMADGQILLGKQTPSCQRLRSPIMLNVHLLGWVSGENVEVVATLISQLAYREF